MAPVPPDHLVPGRWFDYDSARLEQARGLVARPGGGRVEFPITECRRPAAGKDDPECAGTRVPHDALACPDPIRSLGDLGAPAQGRADAVRLDRAHLGGRLLGEPVLSPGDLAPGPAL